MHCCSSTVKMLPLASPDSRPFQLVTLPQWHIVMCRARWLVSPYPSDEGSAASETDCGRWSGAFKAALWTAVAIGSGILIAGLGG